MAVTLPAGSNDGRTLGASGGLARGRVRRWLRPSLIAVFLCTCAFLGGFPVFLALLERREPEELPRGDAIVALTGGVERIPDAVGWLAQDTAAGC